jgi:hypothetical protein
MGTDQIVCTENENREVILVSQGNKLLSVLLAGLTSAVVGTCLPKTVGIPTPQRVSVSFPDNTLFHF